MEEELGGAYARKNEQPLGYALATRASMGRRKDTSTHVRHACVRESLTLLVSQHSLYTSHTQNRYPALQGDQGKWETAARKLFLLV